MVTGINSRKLATRVNARVISTCAVRNISEAELLGKGRNSTRSVGAYEVR